MLKKCLLYILLALFAKSVAGQSVSFFGRVQEGAGKHEPLPFVKVLSKKQKITRVADIDGNWVMTDLDKTDTLIFSCMGYQTRVIPVDSLTFGIYNIITLAGQSKDLATVVILPGINPAERIINQLIKNKHLNDWRRIPSFSYTSYNHFVITSVAGDSVVEKHPTNKNVPTKDKDTSVDSFFKKQDLFIAETVEETKYKAPDEFRKRVTGSKSSGLKNPFLSQLASQFQDFDIYQDLIEVLGKTYISPIENGATKDYLFILEDTLWPGNGDTVFVMSYQPRNGKRFNGFKGSIYISSRQYAVQNFTANPSGSEDNISIKIEQQFEWLDSSQWFPVKLNSTLKFYDVENSDKKIAGVGRSYYSNINLHPDLPRNSFGNIAMEYTSNASDQDSAFWNSKRNRPISNKDKNTYHVVDSVGKVWDLDIKVKILEALIEGRVPIWKFDLDINKILLYNGYEGYRPGLGLFTNDKISPYYSIGGYAGYGFADKAWKYNYSFDYMPIKGSYFRTGIMYSKDLTEFGGTRFPIEKQQSLYGNYRDLYVNSFTTDETKSAYVRWRMLNYLQTQVSFSASDNTLHSSYAFIGPDNITHTHFNFTEAVFTFRYAYKEKLIKLPGKTYEQATNYPILFLQLTNGFKGIAGGEYQYRKADAKIEKTFNIKRLGKSTIQVKAGKTIGDVPLFKEYAGFAEFSKLLNVTSRNTFETMRMNEFYSSQYVYLFYRHSFEKLLLKVGDITPVVGIVQNVGFGSMNNPAAHTGLDYKTMDKGYFESGISLDNLIGSKTSKFGIAFYYRYGAYAFSDPKDNLTIKLTISSIYF